MSLFNRFVLLSAFVLVGGFQDQCQQEKLTKETNCGTRKGCFSETEGRCLQKCKEQACTELEERNTIMKERKSNMKAGKPDPYQDKRKEGGSGGGRDLFSCAIECLPRSDNALMQTKKCMKKRCEIGDRNIRFSTVKEFENFLVEHKIDIKDFTFRVDVSEGSGKAKLGSGGNKKKPS